MGRYVIIATRKPGKERSDQTTTVGALAAFYKTSGWEVRFHENAESMYEVYRTGCQNIKPDDYVIFCHDDIEILMTPKQFNSLIHTKLSKPKAGFLGVAGSAYITSKINWYMCSKEYESGGGVVYHGPSVADMTPSHYGHVKNAVGMDGVFLAAKGAIINSIQLKQPDKITSPWDHYDFFYTAQAHIKGYSNEIIPLPLRHESGGRYPPAYQENVPIMAELFEKHLPLRIKTHHK